MSGVRGGRRRGFGEQGGGGWVACLLWVVLAGCATGGGGGDDPDMATGPARDARVERPDGEPDLGAADEGATGDGAVDGGDEGVAAPDEGAPGEDGGFGADEGAPESDGGGVELDRGVPEPDRGPPELDLSVPEADAGSPELDRGPPDLDRGVPDPDVGPPDPDAGPPDPDFGPPDAAVPPVRGCGVANPFVGLEPARDGRWARVAQFPSGHIRRRDVAILLPVGHGVDPGARYPVMYLHDGQNLFDPADAAFGVEWEVDETVDALTAAGVIEPMIIVALGNTGERIRDYTPSVDPGRGEGGEAGAYARFIVEELKPWVEHRFAVRCGPAHTGLGGSSLGGLVSLYITWLYPDVFGRVAALSPSLWWNRGEAAGWVGGIVAQLDPGERLWLDAGNGEGDDPDGDGLRSVAVDVEAWVDAAIEAGAVFGETVGMQVVAGAPHNEAAWAARLPDVMTFLWGPAPGVPDALVGGPLRWPLSPGERAPLRVDARWDLPLSMTVPPRAVALVARTPEVATVDGDGVRAVAVGQARIGASALGIEAELLVDVVPPELTPIEVRVPASTPADAVIHLAGSDPAIGGWAPDGFALTPAGGRRWTGLLPMPLGTRFEFKVTRGSWETVEKGPNGEELPNRVAVTAGAAIVVEVAAWRDDFE